MREFVWPCSEDELDVPLNLTSGQVFRWRESSGGEWSGVDGEHVYTLRREAEGVRVRTTGTPEDFIRLFRLEVSLAAVRSEIVRLGPELAPYANGFSGLRLMRPSCPREVLFCFLCSANNHISRITSMVGKLAAYGELLAPGYHRFPELEVIANIPEDELRSAGFGYRGRTIPLVARQVAGEGGDLWFERCRSGGYDVAFGELLRLPGVGPKLADCICLYGFHFTEAVPLDTHMWQAACRIYFPELAGKAPTEARYRMIGEFVRTRFGSLAGYAQQLLFVDNLKNWRARPRYAGA